MATAKKTIRRTVRLGRGRGKTRIPISQYVVILTPEPEGGFDAVVPGELTAVAATVGGLVVYAFLLEPIGFIPSTVLIVVALMAFVLRIRSLLLIAGMAIGLSLGSYIVFAKLLGTYLAPGTLITIYF